MLEDSLALMNCGRSRLLPSAGTLDSSTLGVPEEDPLRPAGPDHPIPPKGHGTVCQPKRSWQSPGPTIRGAFTRAYHDGRLSGSVIHPARNQAGKLIRY